jgi:hypothetical protein
LICHHYSARIAATIGCTSFFPSLLLTECLLAYPHPNEGQRVNGTRLPTRGGDEEVRMGPRGPNRLDA